MKIQWKRAERPNWALPFFAGLLAGVFFVYLNTEAFLTENGFLSWMNLERMSRIELNENAFFLYVVGKRFGTIWLVAVLATTFAGIVTTYLFVLWIGVCGGVISTVAVMRYGMKGLLLLAGGMMPQFLFYVPAFLMLADWSMQTCMRLYYPVVDYTEIHGTKTKNNGMFWRFVMLHGVVIIGIILESYVNPNLMTELLKIF